MDPVRNQDDQIRGSLLHHLGHYRAEADGGGIAAARRCPCGGRPTQGRVPRDAGPRLRNPLAPILNSLEEIRLSKPTDLAIGQALDVAGRQVRHMSRLLDDLLDVSRFTRGKIQLRREVVDLAVLVDHAIETARPLIEANRQELSIAMPDRPVRLEGDPTRLAQVVGNLLNNAAKYSEPGGKIRLTLECSGNESLLRVRDNGIGLSAEMLPRVFDLFSQADLPGSLPRGLELA